MVLGAVGNSQIACNLRLRCGARSHQLDRFLLKFSCKGSLLLLHDPFPFCGEVTLSSLLPPLLWVKTKQAYTYLVPVLKRRLFTHTTALEASSQALAQAKERNMP